jgi:sialic acid synthase SpsE
MNELKEKFKMNIAYGNHAENHFVIYLSLAFQPSDILFYVKGSKYKHHIDEPHSIKLKKLEEFVENLKILPNALGNKNKIKLKI